MPAFAPARRRFPRPNPRLNAAWVVGRRRVPPSRALIDAVLEHADLRDAMGGGRTLLRVSPARAADLDLRDALGKDAARLGDIAVIWDEKEDAIFRVLDGGPPPLAAVTDDCEGEGEFALTPAALDYIAGSQSRRRG
jgi:hypothetical protein